MTTQNQNQDTVASAAVDWGQFVLASAVAAAGIAGRQAIGALGEWSAAAIREAYDTASLWWHHDFTVHMRKWLNFAAWVNAGYAMIIFAYGFVHLPMGWPWVLNVVYFTLACVGVFFIRRRYNEMESVKPLSEAQRKEWLSTEAIRIPQFHARLVQELGAPMNAVNQARLIELMQETGLDREALRESLDLELGLTIDPVEFRKWLKVNTKGVVEQRRALKAAFGENGELGMGTASLIVASYGVHAILVLGLASWSYALGATIGNIAGLMVLGVTLLFLSGIAISAVLTLVKLLAVNLIGYGNAMFKGLFEIGFSAAPFIRDNEAKDLMPKIQYADVFKTFVTIAATLPGLFILVTIALFLTFPHPVTWTVAVFILVLVGFGGLTSQAFGNDITESKKATGKFIAFIITCMAFYYACAYLNEIGWFTGVDTYLEGTGLYRWWNAFAGMGLCAFLGLLPAVLLAMYGISKIPSEGKWLKRIKYGLMGLCGLILLAAGFGQIAHLAGMDAYVGNDHPPTLEERRTDAERILEEMHDEIRQEREARERREREARERAARAQARADAARRAALRREAAARQSRSHRGRRSRRVARSAQVASSGNLPTCQELNPEGDEVYWARSRARGRCR